MFSSIYLNVILFTVALIFIGGLLMTMDEQVASIFSMRKMKDPMAELQCTDMRMTGFNYTNYSTPDKVELYFTSYGCALMETDCLDLYIDGFHIERQNLTVTILDTDYDPNHWNPDEEIEVETLTDLTVGEHTARLAACNAAYNEGVFNASLCGDATCTGGEYCDRDNSTCTDNVCYEPRCWNGCIEYAITSAEDAGECDNTGTGCNTDGCECDGSSNCCGSDGSTGCTVGDDCCAGICNEGTCGSTLTEKPPTQSADAAFEETLSNSFPDLPDGTYPGSCPNDRLYCDDNQVEDHSADANQYCGIRAVYYDTTIDNCNDIISVELCHEWWITASGPSDCDVSVSNDGSSWSEEDNTCYTSASPGITCTDVTSSFSWTCSDFFGAGANGAYIRQNAQSDANNKRCRIDNLYYNIEYS